MYAGIHSLIVLLVLRAIHGGSYGVASTTTGAIAADLVPDRRKGPPLRPWIRHRLLRARHRRGAFDYANMYRFAALFVILSAAVYYILHHRRANAKATSAM